MEFYRAFCFFWVLLLSPGWVLAETYLYGNKLYTCDLSGDVQSIGEVDLDFQSKLFFVHGVETFKSEAIAPAFISRKTLPLTLANYSFSNNLLPRDFYQKNAQGKKYEEYFFYGIPNAQADQNWPVTANNKKVVLESAFEETVVKASVEMVKGERKDKDYIEFKSALSSNPLVLRDILIAIGAKDVPDFTKYPPVITQSGSITFTDMIQWTDHPKSMPYIGDLSVLTEFNGNRGRAGEMSFQIHYPPDQFNGLSYHLRYKCGPSTDYLVHLSRCSSATRGSLEYQTYRCEVL